VSEDGDTHLERPKYVQVLESCTSLNLQQGRSQEMSELSCNLIAYIVECEGEERELATEVESGGPQPKVFKRSFNLICLTLLSDHDDAPLKPSPFLFPSRTRLLRGKHVLNGSRSLPLMHTIFEFSPLSPPIHRRGCNRALRQDESTDI